MKVEAISDAKRKSITDDMISVADKIAAADLQKQKVSRQIRYKSIVRNIGGGQMLELE